ncbi:MAG: extracellular solute-binding protein [Caldilineaceae bacterium]|nr:extracellular solute-binding protein [Caldilineaceae bacterium]MCB0141202.1 extracellular solute-binding protein [Caldilineaceae bacterium]
MKSQQLSRRGLLKMLGAGTATLALAACAPAAGPAAAPESGSSSGDATSEKIQMSVATFAAVLHDWQREFAKRWGEEHADQVDLQIEEVVYNEMAKLQLARSASGTLWDLTFSGIKWFPYSASKGMFLQLDDFLANRDDANLDDFFETALAGGYLDGNLFGLPYEIHPGNPALVVFNLDMLEEKGFEMPTDDWDVAQYAEIASQTSDPENNVFGTNYLPGSYYDFESLARAYGTDMMSEDRSQFLFNVDEKCIEAARWTADLRTSQQAAPKRDEVEGIDFTAGNMLVSQVTGSYSVNNFATQIGDAFRHDWVLFPRGPEGNRGYTAFTSNYSVASTTADPDLAVDLLVYLTSTEAGTWSALEQGTGQPNARRSVWENEDLLAKSHPIFRRVVAMFNDSSIPGPFPMPSNLRFQELQDNWANTMPDLFYGDVPFEEGMQAVQDACQEILDLPRA